jgi:molecular chaperone GrpE
MANETEVEADVPPHQAASDDGLAADLDAELDSEEDELAAMKGSLADLTNDLQRLSAEYANYRKRVDRDRQLVAETAAYKALAPVVEVLDTIDRAKEHGELESGLKAVADQLERVVGASGLVRFGEPGDAFDPTLHEALSHLGTDAEVQVTTVKHVAKGGYKIGDRVVRAAQVLVVDPVEG